MVLDDFLETLLRGMQTGALYALVALGLSIAYRATKVFNFAHGEFVMIGTVTGVLLWQEAGVPVVAALILAAMIALGGAVLVERIAVRPVVHHHNPQWIVSTLGASVVVSAVFHEILLSTGPRTEVRPFPNIVPWETTRWRDVIINPTRLLPIVTLVLVTIAVSLLLSRTDFGRAFAAVSDDREAAAMRGIPVMRVSIMAFALAGLTAGIAGFVAGPITQASAHSGLTLTVKAFVASAIGGLGTIRGAVVGGLVLGLIEAATVQYLNTRFQEPLVLVAFLLVLSGRPQGLMSRKLRAV